MSASGRSGRVSGEARSGPRFLCAKLDRGPAGSGKPIKRITYKSRAAFDSSSAMASIARALFVLFSIVRPSILGVIPARHASSRFPGKPLALIGGKPMLEPSGSAAAIQVSEPGSDCHRQP